MDTTDTCNAPAPIVNRLGRDFVADPGCIYDFGHRGAHGNKYGAWGDRGVYDSSLSRSQDLCRDVFDHHEANALPCGLEHDHGGDHRVRHYTWPDSHRWLSVSTDPAPGGQPACRAPGRVVGADWLCQRDLGHAGDHEDSPGCGESVHWPVGTRCGNDSICIRDGEPISCNLPTGHDGDHEDNKGFADSIRWPNRPWHRQLADAVDARDMHVARMNRDRAVEHAINALAPVAGAFALIPGAGNARADYGEALIDLATRLGHHIKNGS
jgi:hypothetical protein